MSTVTRETKEDNLIPPKKILGNRWEVIKLIGKGSFSEIYEARDVTVLPTSLGNRVQEFRVAIKVASKAVESTSIVSWESSVMSRLQEVPSVPRVYKGDSENTVYFAMELLTGEDMSKLRNRIRDANPTKLIPINIASYFARQMLRNLQDIHKHGFVHRDVKPSNFIRVNRKSNRFYTIDFGLAKMYHDEYGQVRPPPGAAEFRGTTLYASPFSHHGLHQCPRDDLISVIHVFLDMACGTLPWGVHARNRDKVKVVEIKNLCYSDSAAFVREVTKATIEAEKNHNVEATNFPPCAQASVEAIVEYLRLLEYDSIVDYDRIDQLLLQCIPEGMDKSVDDINFKCPVFSWLEDSSAVENKKRTQSYGDIAVSQPAVPPVVTDPVAAQIRNLTTRVSALSKDAVQTSKPDNNQNKITREQRMAFTSTRWKNCLSELFKVDPSHITEELLQAFADVLRLNCNFLEMYVASWNDFEGLQLDIMKFYRFQAEVLQKMKSIENTHHADTPSLKRMKSRDEHVIPA